MTLSAFAGRFTEGDEAQAEENRAAKMGERVNDVVMLRGVGALIKHTAVPANSGLSNQTRFELTGGLQSLLQLTGHDPVNHAVKLSPVFFPINAAGLSCAYALNFTDGDGF